MALEMKQSYFLEGFDALFEHTPNSSTTDSVWRKDFRTIKLCLIQHKKAE